MRSCRNFLDEAAWERVVVPGTGYIKQVDLHDEDECQAPVTLYLPSVKLDLGVLQMAESIVFIHESSGGRIVHNDIQLSQFLYAHDGSIKFNDFNRAEPMLWDEDKQEFCRYRNGAWEWSLSDLPKNTSTNPWLRKLMSTVLANNVYGLLTGLEPFYEIDEEHAAEAQEKLKRGERPYVDPRYRGRSYEEDVLDRYHGRMLGLQPR
jgi:serine/threonine protein kinase